MMARVDTIRKTAGEETAVSSKDMKMILLKEQRQQTTMTVPQRDSNNSSSMPVSDASSSCYWETSNNSVSSCWSSTEEMAVDVDDVQKTKKESSTQRRTSTRAKRKTKARSSSSSSTSTSLSYTNKGFERAYIKHNYHDRALELPPQKSPADDAVLLTTNASGTSQPFPYVLHRLLQASEVQGYADIVRWQPHGRAFLIVDATRFVQDVLPRFFKHTKIASFQRQLSLYGFLRLTNDHTPDRGAYYHESFLRDRPFLCADITRTRVKGTWVRRSSSPDSEPNFYQMDPVAPLDAIPADRRLKQQQQAQEQQQARREPEDIVSSTMIVPQPLPPPVALLDNKSNAKSMDNTSSLLFDTFCQDFLPAWDGNNNNTKPKHKSPPHEPLVPPPSTQTSTPTTTTLVCHHSHSYNQIDATLQELDEFLGDVDFGIPVEDSVFAV